MKGHLSCGDTLPRILMCPLKTDFTVHSLTYELSKQMKKATIKLEMEFIYLSKEHEQ